MSELSKEDWIERATWVLETYGIHLEPEEECRVCLLLKQLKLPENQDVLELSK